MKNPASFFDGYFRVKALKLAQNCSLTKPNHCKFVN